MTASQPHSPPPHRHAHDHHDHAPETNSKSAAATAAISCCGGCGPTTHAHDEGDDHPHSHDHSHDALPGWRRIALGLALALGAEVAHYLARGALPGLVVSGVLALLAIAATGTGVYREGLGALRRGKLNISALMAVAVTGAVLIGQWPEAAMVMALYALAERIEERAAERARNAIGSLMALAPDEAEVRDDTGRWVTTPLAAVPLDAVLRIKPGERVPLDGDVTAGRGAVDQASVTGESVPVDKAPGDTLWAGTLNLTGELQLRVTAAAGRTTLDRIVAAVAQAQAARAPTQRFVDRFAAVYTPAMFGLALALALLGPLLLGLGWLEAVYQALVLLVIACPCALVIATPVTVVSALAAAAKRGLLIKGGSHLEQARRITVAGLDKTGTLTEGAPALVATVVLRGDEAAARRIALALAARSDHPVSRALARGLAADDAGNANAADAAEAQDFTALPGRGVQATLDGQAYVLGNRRLIGERGQASEVLDAELARQAAQGRSVTLLAGENGADGQPGVLALFAVADRLRPGAREAVAALRALGIRPVMLTGDNAATARAVAAEAGIDDVRAELLPEDKLAAVQALAAEAGGDPARVAMAGDGINDAPALAQAGIGFAMGAAGTDVALETADVVVMNDRLASLADTVRLSRRTHTVLWQNIAIALGIKAVFFGLALAGSATLWMAVFADMGASLLVIANGLRLRKAW